MQSAALCGLDDNSYYITRLDALNVIPGDNRKKLAGMWKTGSERTGFPGSAGKKAGACALRQAPQHLD
jgi:hypothetical protein